MNGRRYGQTGSGKTFTMGGFFNSIARDLFAERVEQEDFLVSVAVVEIAGSKCYGIGVIVVFLVHWN